MADNELKIKVSIDKATLENVKSENRKLVAQIKADAQKSVKELESINKLELQQSKNINAQILLDKKLAYQKDKDAYRQAQQEKRAIDRQNEQERKRIERANRPMSTFQKLEVGENIATIAVGFGLALGVARQFSQELWNMAKAGAELQVLQRHFEKISGSVEQANLDMELLRTAVSGNLNDKELIQFTNRMREMGRTTQESAQILDFAERTTDVMGGTIEEAQAKLFKFIETGKGKGFEQMGVNIALVNQRVEELAKAQGKTTATMEVEELATLRLTTFMSMYGDSLDKIKNKQPELDDKLISSEKKFDNLKGSLGILVAEGLEPTVTSFGKLIDLFQGGTTIMQPWDRLFQSLTDKLVGTKDVMNALTNPLSTLINLLTDKFPKAVNQFQTALSKMFDGLAQNPPVAFLGGAFQMIGDLIDKVRELLGWMNKIPGVDISMTDGFARMGSSTMGEAKSGTSNYRSDKTGGTGKNERVNEEKAILNERQKQLEIIKQIQAELLLNVNIIGAEIELNKKLFEAKQRLLFLDTGITVGNQGILTGETLANRNLNFQTGGDSFIKSKDFEVALKQMIEPLNTAFSESFSRVKDVFGNIIDVFNLGTDTFISKLISGFDTVLSIVNMITSAFEAVNAIKGFMNLATSFIPGGSAIGGLSGGGSMPMPMMSNSRPIINVQVQSEVESVKAVRFFENNFNAYQNAMKGSSF